MRSPPVASVSSRSSLIFEVAERLATYVLLQCVVQRHSRASLDKDQSEHPEQVRFLPRVQAWNDVA